MSHALTLRLMTPTIPEWRRSGPYLLLAIALHAALLLFGRPLHRAWEALEEARPLSVTLLKAPEPLPLAPARQEPPHPTPAAHRERPQPRPSPTPVLAMTPEQQPATNAPAVVAPTAPAPVADAVARSTAPAAATGTPTPSVSAARFDAAYLQNPKPNYPALSRRLGEEGKVLLKVRVGSDGRPLAVDLEKSSNFERLDNAARQVVLSWRFVPAKRGEEAVEATVVVPIVFRLDS